MGQVRWTREAELWLHDIYDYIAADNPNAALRTVQGIANRAETLTKFPERGYLHKEGSPVRILLYDHYRIAYLPSENGDVNILGIFHGALDIGRFLP
jgi:plasmid stabilization system protein ParE